MKTNMNKIGVIEINTTLLEESGQKIKELLISKVLVLHCEHLYHRGTVKYVVQCDDLPEVEKGTITPEYQIICETTKVGEDYEITSMKFTK